ncbi:MAG TPA: hypothetical protein V6D47_01910, partial [Oscillatoriaceae cyanobacterium]
MIQNSTLRLVGYQARQQSGAQASGGAAPTPTAPQADTASFSVSAPLTNTQATTDLGIIEGQLSKVQKECLALIKSMKPGSKPTGTPTPAPAPKPAPAPQPAPAPKPAPKPASGANNAEIAKLEKELAGVQKQATSLMGQLKALSGKKTTPP